MRFLRDLPALKAAFAELGPKGWKKILAGGDGQHAALARKAWKVFISDYFTDEAAAEALGDAADIPQEAAKRYLRALEGGRVPIWIRHMALENDIRRAARE